MALDKVKLERYLREFSETATDWFEEAVWLRQRYDFFQSFFRAEKLQGAEWEDFQKLRGNIHSFAELKLAGAKALGRKNHSIEHYRKSFLHLAHGEGDLFDRVSDFDSSSEYRVKYFGQGAISEMAGYLFAEKVMFFNSRDVHGAKFFGIERKRQRGEKLGDKLRSFTTAVMPVAEAYEKTVGWRTELPHFLELDQFFSWLYETHRKTVEGGTDPEPPVPPDQRIESDGTNAAAPLNLVLYGPPGTGKTYQTVNLAIQICLPGQPVPKERSKAVEEFRRLREQGRVEFVTFHQSYGYEEFVEGIRPETVKDDTGATSLSYDVQPGVFKRISLAAKEALKEGRQRYAFDPSKTAAWKMSLGDSTRADEAHIFETCMNEGLLMLGYGQGLDFTGCDTRDAVATKLREKLPDIPDNDYNITSVHRFKNEMAGGGLVVVSDGNKKFRAIGRIAGPYTFRPDLEYYQVRAVEWLRILDESLPAEQILKVNFSQMTIYRLNLAILKAEAMQDLLAGTKSPGERNHVLIIDELNRGNVSKILGELITLLEPDKRLGAENELTATLPYSGDEFGVPPNLYVIGTMNSADRSIAFIDTALRRRFQFREVPPDSEVLRAEMPDGGLVAGVEVPALLDIINDRIELLFDRDHTLGHSFFIRVSSLDDLRQVVLEKVIPQLQEYFYGDWHRVCLVLGCPYQTDGEQPTTENPFPVFTAEKLPVSALLGTNNGEYEDQFRFAISHEFLESKGLALANFFKAVMGQPTGDGSA